MGRWIVVGCLGNGTTVSGGRKNLSATLATWPSQGTTGLDLRPIVLLGNFYSSQPPEGKVQTYDLERLGESREPSRRVCCRQLSCLGRFHHDLHHCPGCFTFYRRVSGQKILLSVCMLSLGLAQVECEFCGGKASSVLVYHWILHLNSTWTSRYLIPVTNCPHFCSVYSHTLREAVGAVFSLK